MAVTVTEAIYRARVEGQQSVDGLARSVDSLSVSEEKLTRATRASEDGFERLRGRLDPAVRAHQQYQQVVEQVVRYEQAGIGTSQERAQVVDMATRKYMDQVAALQRAAQAHDQYNRSQSAAGVNASGAVNQRLGVTDDFGTTGRAADVAAYGQELDRLRAKYNPLFAVQQQYRATLAEISTALKVGALSEREYAAAKERTKAGFASQVVAIQRFGSATTMSTASLSQLSFQINDIATGLLMGQSPFQIMAQQGGQVLQVWQMNRNVFKDLWTVLSAGVARVMAFLGPWGMVAAAVAAVSAAAYGLFSLLRTSAPTVEQTLKEQERLVGLLKQAYSDAGNSVEKFNARVSSGLLLQGQQTLLAMQNQLREMSKQMEKSFTTPTSVPSEIPGIEGGMQIENAQVISREYGAYRQALDNFFSAINQGAPQAAAALAVLDKAIGDLGRSNPLIAEQGVQILKQFEAIFDHARKMKELEDAMKPKAPARGPNSYETFVQRTRDRIEELKAEAQYAGLASDAVMRLRLQHEAERAAKQAKVPINQKVIDQMKEELALAEKMKAIANVRANIEFDRSTIGLTDQDARIAEQLRGIYGNDVASALASAEAAQMRWNDQLRVARDLWVDFGSGIASDLRAGVEPLQALTNALNRFADKLFDMAMNRLLQQAFGGLIGLGASTSSSGMGLSLTKTGGLFHQGGVVGASPVTTRYVHPAVWADAPRYHGGGLIGRERAIIAEDDEEVLTRQDPRHRWNGGMMPAMNAPAPVMKVNVINYGNSSVETSEPKQNADGSISIDVLIDQMTAKNLNRPGSASNKAMRNYGVDQNLTHRG